MKHLTLKQCIIVIRVAAIALVLVIASLFLFSFTVERKMTDDLWKTLGIDKMQGTNQIKESFYHNYFYCYGVKNIKKIAENNRGAVARDLLSYTKQYVNSPEFKKAYEQWRLEGKPIAPELAPVRTTEQVQKEEIAKSAKMIKDTEEQMKKMTPEIQKAMQKSLEYAKKQHQEYLNPNYKLWKVLVENDVRENEYKQERYKKDMENWEKEQPVDARIIIKSRLQKLLDVTANVDYDAELKEKYGKKVFVNPEYERKPSEWKMAFRAGKDVTETTRKFVAQWLAEMK
jgi:hypothetical protein